MTDECSNCAELAALNQQLGAAVTELEIAHEATRAVLRELVGAFNMALQPGNELASAIALDRAMERALDHLSDKPAPVPQTGRSATAEYEHCANQACMRWLVDGRYHCATSHRVFCNRTCANQQEARERAWRS